MVWPQKLSDSCFTGHRFVAASQGEVSFAFVFSGMKSQCCRDFLGIDTCLHVDSPDVLWKHHLPGPSKGCCLKVFDYNPRRLVL